MMQLAGVASLINVTPMLPCFRWERISTTERDLRTVSNRVLLHRTFDGADIPRINKGVWELIAQFTYICFSNHHRPFAFLTIFSVLPDVFATFIVETLFGQHSSFSSYENARSRQKFEHGSTLTSTDETRDRVYFGRQQLSQLRHLYASNRTAFKHLRLHACPIRSMCRVLSN
jgi:hypothetical protein